MKKIFLVSFCLVIACCHMVLAGQPVIVHVTPGKISEVEFPETVAKVIKGGMADSVLVEVVDRNIYILPKTDTPADISVMGISGESYPLNLLLSPQNDIHVHVNGSLGPRAALGRTTDTMGLMKEILLGREPAGATVLKGGHEIKFNADQIKFTVDIVYDLPYAAVYILKSQNLTDDSLAVPLEQISFPNLLAITSAADMLRPQGQDGDITKVILITGK